VMANAKPGSWSRAEEMKVIEAYRQLWLAEQRGGVPDIAGAIAQLDEVAKEPGAIRMRMSNISAVLDERSIRWVKGLSPLRNYARQTKELVDSSLPWA
jgi:hypothetical protein